MDCDLNLTLDRFHLAEPVDISRQSKVYDGCGVVAKACRCGSMVGVEISANDGSAAKAEKCFHVSVDVLITLAGSIIEANEMNGEDIYPFISPEALSTVTQLQRWVVREVGGCLTGFDLAGSMRSRWRASGFRFP
ncbi:hypothetical protein TNCV_4994941 [Trichonephila clavipes]|nr:hypothetical protein TNCV_4994941 [Trichonephila clavipes]